MAFQLRWPRLAVATVLCCVASAVLNTQPALAADGDVALDPNGGAVITVVGGAPGGPPGGGDEGNAGHGGTRWLYRCVWLHAWAGTNIGLDRPDALVPGTSYSVSCHTIAEPHAPHPTLNAVLIPYNPADPIPGATDSIELANQARAQAQLRPDPLPVGISPDPLQITGVETWLWPDGSTAHREAFASADGLTVTVRAIYQQTIFNVDEPGVAPIVCDNAEPWTPGASSSACSHVYLTEGAGRTVTAESAWSYVWHDNGAQIGWVAWETVSFTEEQTLDVVDIEAVISSSN